MNLTERGKGIKIQGFQLIVNASTKREAGSGFHETNLGSCVVSLVANKSISEVPQWVVI